MVVATVEEGVTGLVADTIVEVEAATTIAAVAAEVEMAGTVVEAEVVEVVTAVEVAMDGGVQRMSALQAM